MTKQIYLDIEIERQRQDALHPELPKYLLNKDNDPSRPLIKESLAYIQKENNVFEAQGEHSWYGILYEEQKEIFASDTLEELYKETIQAAAVLIRLAETIKNGGVTI